MGNSCRLLQLTIDIHLHLRFSWLVVSSAEWAVWHASEVNKYINTTETQPITHLQSTMYSSVYESYVPRTRNVATDSVILLSVVSASLSVYLYSPLDRLHALSFGSSDCRVLKSPSYQGGAAATATMRLVKQSREKSNQRSSPQSSHLLSQP